MKLINKIFYFFLVIIIICSCKKEADVPFAVDNDTNATAKLKVVYASAYVLRDSIQIKINDQRVSNTFLSLNATTFVPTPFPGGGLNTGGGSFPYYFSIAPGDTKIFVSVPKKGTTLDSIIRYSGMVNLQAGRYYSAYITDTLLTARTVLVEENMAEVNYGISRFKFVNLVPNLPAIDLYFDTIKVASNIAFGTVSPEFTLAYKSVGQWRIRPAGALTTVVPFATYPGTFVQQGTFPVPNQRAITVFAKGYSGQTSSRTPTISLLYNK